MHNKKEWKPNELRLPVDEPEIGGGRPPEDDKNRGVTIININGDDEDVDEGRKHHPPQPIEIQLK